MLVTCPFVSVVFSAYKTDRYPYILKAIETISNQTYRNFETIIVVDGNEELHSILYNMCNDLRKDINLSIIKNEKRGGPSVARNIGIAESKGNIIVITDDDVFVTRDWLEKIVKNFEYDDILMVGGRILPDYERGASILPEEVLWIVGCTYKGHPIERQKVRNVISANMAFRKELFDNISFEPSYEGDWRMSDTLIGIKTNEYRNGSVVYDPEPVVYHNVPRERTKLYYFIKRSYTEGFLKAFLRKKSVDQNMYNYEYGYLTCLVGSIPRYLFTFRIRNAIANSVVLMSVGLGFLMGSLSIIQKNSKIKD